MGGFADVFTAADANDDGYIDASELPGLITALVNQMGVCCQSSCCHVGDEGVVDGRRLDR